MSENYDFDNQPNTGPGYGYPMGRGGVAPRPLPGRGGAIALIIFGAVAMLILAPIAFFGILAFSSIDKLDAVALHTVANGSEVEVDSSGIVTVTYAENFVDETGVHVRPGTKVGETMPDCSIDGEGGYFDLEASPSRFGAVATEVPSGLYTLQCNNADDQEILVSKGEEMRVFAGRVLNGAVSAMVPAIVTGSIIALVGLVCLILGILRLGRVNRQRSYLEFARLRP